MDPRNGKIIDILLVEDNPGDVRLMQEAIREAKVANTMHVVHDGEEAMQFLRKQGKFESVDRPDLVLLDLNLPKKDGRAVLAEVKQDPLLKRIPIVVLTTSKDEADIFKAYDNHANCYITKPPDLEQFLTVVRQIKEFWLTIVQFPKT